MYSNLKEIVIKIATEKGVELTGGRKDRIRDIERQLDNEKISVEDAINLLRKEFSDNLKDYNLKDEDYSKIRKKVEWK